MPDWSRIEDTISAATGRPFRADSRRPVGGGCINAASVLASAKVRYFVKSNQAGRLWMFEAEAEGLRALAETGPLAVPAPVCSGVAGEDAFLVLEHLELGGGSAATGAALGRQLAALHGAAQGYFGWKMDNAIGATPQRNPGSDDWPDFFRRNRLEYQLELAARSGRGGVSLMDKGARLGERMGGLFDGYAPFPSLLHGDLWSGNAGALRDGRPVVFDPAVYFGDREADIAMTGLFGGFPREFHDAYSAAFALDKGFEVRRTLYNLYHVLNHLNLFGGGYARMAEGMMDELLAELG